MNDDRAGIARTLGIARTARRRLAEASLLGAGAIGASIALMGTSAWLISRAAQRPSEASLTLAIVGVQFFGLSRGFFRYGERLVGHDAALRVLAGLRVRVFERLEVGRSCRAPGLPPGRPRGPLRRRRGFAPRRGAAGAAALPGGGARRGGHRGGPLVVPPPGRRRPSRRPPPLGDGRALADRTPGPPRGVPAGRRAGRAHGERRRSGGRRARAARDGRGRRPAGPHRRIGQPLAPGGPPRGRHRRASASD